MVDLAAAGRAMKNGSTRKSDALRTSSVLNSEKLNFFRFFFF
jgi:hypothetical protein